MQELPILHQDGTVLFDNKADADEMENHKRQN